MGFGVNPNPVHARNLIVQSEVKKNSSHRQNVLSGQWKASRIKLIMALRIRTLHPRGAPHQVTCVCVCARACVFFSTSEDVSDSNVVVYVIICRCNSHSGYSQPSSLRFANTIFHSYVFCLLHQSLVKVQLRLPRVFLREPRLSARYASTPVPSCLEKIRRHRCAKRM